MILAGIKASLGTWIYHSWAVPSEPKPLDYGTCLQLARASLKLPEPTLWTSSFWDVKHKSKGQGIPGGLPQMAELHHRGDKGTLGVRARAYMAKQLCAW